MISRRDRRLLGVVVRHLSRADHFNKLAKSCQPQHRRSLYRLKDRALDQAIALSPEDFEVDSISRGHEPILGVTHLPSGRRFHVRPYSQEYVTQVILHRSAEATGHEYPFSGTSEIHIRTPRRGPALPCGPQEI